MLPGSWGEQEQTGFLLERPVVVGRREGLDCAAKWTIIAATARRPLPFLNHLAA